MTTESQIAAHIDAGFAKIAEGLKEREDRRDGRLTELEQIVTRLGNSVERMVEVLVPDGRTPLAERVLGLEHKREVDEKRITNLEDERKSLVRWAFGAITTAVLAAGGGILHWFLGMKTAP